MIIQRQGIKLILSFTILLCIGGFIISSVSAQELQITPSVSTSNEAIDGEQTKQQALPLNNQIDEIQSAIASQEGKTNQKIRDLEGLITAQRDIINDLKVDLNSVIDKPITNGSTFEVWSSIVLGAAALIVTTLGVIIAILTFIGYDQLVNKGAKKAEDKAVDEAKKVIPSLVEEKTKDALDTLIAEGYLNPVVEEIMQEIAYRNIGFDDDPTN